MQKLSQYYRFRNVCLEFCFLLLFVIFPFINNAETICFLLKEREKLKRYNDSFVIKLSKPEDIAYARRIIAEPTNSLLNTGIAASIALGADGINRNYLAPGAPEWSWHIKEFQGFTQGAILEAIFSPTQIEWNPVFFTSRYPYSNIAFLNYRITTELGPILDVSIAKTNNNLLLVWADMNKKSYTPTGDWGTVYRYTIEKQNNMNEAWKPLTSVNWPLLTNQWYLEKTNSSGFYRVKAQLVPNPTWEYIFGRAEGSTNVGGN